MHTERLHKQRVIKQKQQPVIVMTKGEVQQRRLESHVLHEDEEMLTVSVWWQTVTADEEVEVQLPHEPYGLIYRHMCTCYPSLSSEFTSTTIVLLINIANNA